ncbi:FkbM family methyltransferase [Thioalkalivibrio nitratireducens]|uniref:FkbM family methyltransferase n=1 Tax=Thioalkalivibrio nitratireducens TaxID=186931 RepID=UPI0009FB5AE5|nr:FkbM family methyltransferase [Thioalkalivibrio nitratireducens]
MALNQTFYARATATGHRFGHVAEVGVYHPETSNVHDFILDGVRATLVEPEPASVELIRAYFQGRPNVELHACALCDFDGEVKLLYRGSSTHVATLDSSPALVNDGANRDEARAFTAPCTRFSTIDDGSIDLLSVDTEGSEWFVLKHMTSRPTMISVETHGGAYTNPYLREIRHWMERNGYTIWYKDRSDSVYVRRGEIAVTPLDRLRVWGMDARIRAGALAKRLKQWFRAWAGARSGPGRGTG